MPDAEQRNPANNGLEVRYASSNDIGTLCGFYEGAPKDGMMYGATNSGGPGVALTYEKDTGFGIAVAQAEPEEA